MTRTSGRRTRRTPLVRARRLILGELDPVEREVIIDELYSIFTTYFTGVARDDFVRVALPTANTRFALLYALDGVMAGFVSTTIQELTIDGRVYAAMGGSAFVRAEYRGGSLAGAFALSEALRFWMRHPRVPFGYLGAVLGPTTYQRFAQTFGRIYPNRQDGLPAEIARLVRAFSEARGLVLEGAPPWSVALGCQPLRTATITSARAVDPDIRYYCAHNPGYVDGRALIMWVPLDASNLAQACRSLGQQVWRAAVDRVTGRARGVAPAPG